MRQFEAKSEKGSGLDVGFFFGGSVLGTSEQNKCLQAAVASAFTEDTTAADRLMHAVVFVHEHVYAFVLKYHLA